MCFAHWVSLLRRLRGLGSLHLLAAAAGSFQRVEISGALQQVREVGYASQQQPGVAEASGQHGGQGLEHVCIQVSPDRVPDMSLISIGVCDPTGTSAVKSSDSPE